MFCYPNRTTFEGCIAAFFHEWGMISSARSEFLCGLVTAKVGCTTLAVTSAAINLHFFTPLHSSSLPSTPFTSSPVRLTPILMARVVLIPGNGVYDVRSAMWYPSVIDTLAKEVHADTKERLFPGGGVLRNFPDPLYAHENNWIQFMRDDIQINEDDVVIGHSSGAAAIMRYIETHKVKGVVLVSAYYTDLGDETEVRLEPG